MNDVDVLIPTLRRPDRLSRALHSVFTQDRAAELIAAIVVVDNSPEGSAAELVEALRPASPAALVYVHEPRPGVATARNAGLLASASPLVAFLDDDEEAPPQWLGELHAAHLKLGSAVTFGPVRGIALDARPEFRAYLDRFFSRLGGAQTELIATFYGCGNSMMTRAVAFVGPEPFDTRSDLTGGEDDRLFNRLRNGGERFGWAADAWVYEYAPPHRAHVRYALRLLLWPEPQPSQRTGTRLGGLGPQHGHWNRPSSDLRLSGSGPDGDGPSVGSRGIPRTHSPGSWQDDLARENPSLWVGRRPKRQAG